MDAKPEAVKIPKVGGGKSHSCYQHSKSQCNPPGEMRPQYRGARRLKLGFLLKYMIQFSIIFLDMVLLHNHKIVIYNKTKSFTCSTFINHY